MNPEITLITKRGAETLMSKRIFLDETGKVRSDGSQLLDGSRHRDAGHGCNSGRPRDADHVVRFRPGYRAWRLEGRASGSGGDHH